ncbi:DUF2630 family protein [Luedemannella helvata]|uniref:DUF2630 family protein n=2 Tax=Luedemannella helvata TaxID=349315 RepID=A0ABP4WZL8_9ACTN
MQDKTIHDQIHALVDEEHRLRSALQAGDISSEEEHARLRELEVSLDQCWDLLRRRRAASDAGLDPDTVGERAANEVESYLQ